MNRNFLVDVRPHLNFKSADYKQARAFIPTKYIMAAYQDTLYYVMPYYFYDDFESAVKRIKYVARAIFFQDILEAKKSRPCYNRYLFGPANFIFEPFSFKSRLNIFDHVGVWLTNGRRFVTIEPYCLNEPELRLFAEHYGLSLAISNFSVWNPPATTLAMLAKPKDFSARELQSLVDRLASMYAFADNVEIQRT